MPAEGSSLCGDQPNVLGALGQTYAMAGRPDQARKILAEMHALAEQRFIPHCSMAVIHVGLGEDEAALELLEKACGQREPPLASIGVHALWDPFANTRPLRRWLKSLALAVLSDALVKPEPLPYCDPSLDIARQS